MIKWTSVLKLINSYFPEFDSIEMANKCSKGNNPKYKGRCPLIIALEWSAKGQKACDKGNMMHESIEAYMGKKCSFLPQYKYITAFLRNLSQEYKLLKSEYRIEHQQYQVVGIVDAIFTNRKTGKLLIVDWKTNEKIDKYNKYSKGLGILDTLPDCKLSKYSLQLNFYKALIQDEFDIEGAEMAIIHITDEIELINVRDMEKEIGLILFERGVL